MDFPDISVQDTVRLQLHLLRDGLGVRSVKSVIGGSFGGMQAVEFAAQAGVRNSEFCNDDDYDDGTLSFACPCYSSADTCCRPCRPYL